MTTEQQIAALTTAGLTAIAERERVYVDDGAREFGYLVPGDDGSTGTCRHLTRRAGYVASILRAAGVRS